MEESTSGAPRNGFGVICPLTAILMNLDTQSVAKEWTWKPTTPQRRRRPCSAVDPPNTSYALQHSHNAFGADLSTCRHHFQSGSSEGGAWSGVGTGRSEACSSSHGGSENRSSYGEEILVCGRPFAPMALALDFDGVVKPRQALLSFLLALLLFTSSVYDVVQACKAKWASSEYHICKKWLLSLWRTCINLTLFRSRMKCSTSRRVDISRLCMHLIPLHQESISWYVFMIIKTALSLCNIIYKYLESLVLACGSKLTMAHTTITIKWRWMLFWGLQCISAFRTVHLIFGDARNIHILTFRLGALKFNTLCTLLKALFSLTLLSRSAFYHLSESLDTAFSHTCIIWSCIIWIKELIHVCVQFISVWELKWPC